MLKLFPNVEILEIRNSNLTPIHDSFFLSIPKLKKFSIFDSFTVRKDEDISACCKNVEVLELVNSGLAAVPWEKIEAHWPIKRLLVSQQHIPHLEGSSINVGGLQDLTIEKSNLEHIDNDAFEGLVHLESLNLQSNKIKKITKEMLAPMIKLKVLNLRNNLLEKLTTDQFPSLPNLEIIDIRGNKNIKEIDLTGIKQLAPQLKEIRIPLVVGVELGKSGGVKLVIDFFEH
ncbi:hypothetical protein WA026_019498 [Henosepilachna vigintioctopunctata]|uniref:Uncharacterized protein n=1 Tax=Henosepilachna vigintioctopunctata TaxID=420089 RepID=A0AAW1TXA8_9CUCU